MTMIKIIAWLIAAVSFAPVATAVAIEYFELSMASAIPVGITVGVFAGAFCAAQAIKIKTRDGWYDE